MKIFLILIALLASCVGCSKQDRSNVLILGTNPAYPPYESIGAKGDCVGFDIDVAEAIADKLGKNLAIKELSFDALILALKQEKIDMIISGMSITSARLEEIAMIPYQGEPLKSLALTFWKEIPKDFTKLEDLKTIAVQVGTYQEGYLFQNPHVKTKPLEGNTEIIMDLQYGKSPAAIFEPHIAKVMQQKFKELQVVEIPMDEKNWALGNGVGIKKENKELFEEVSQAIYELKEEGVIQSLEHKWFES